MTTEAPSRRRRIEDVASSLFRERGYAATSIRDIARALDIRGPSVYAHVTSKEDVLWAIVDRAASRFERAAAEAAADLDAERRGAAARLAAFVRAHVGVVTADPGEAGVFVHEWRSLSSERREAIRSRRDAYEQRVRQLIADGVSDGEFAVTDPAIAAAFILTALNGLATWYDRDGRLPARRIADHYADLAVRALTEDSR